MGIRRERSGAAGRRSAGETAGPTSGRRPGASAPRRRATAGGFVLAVLMAGGSWALPPPAFAAAPAITSTAAAPADVSSPLAAASAAARLRRWDEALRLVSMIPAGSDDSGAARALGERVLLARQTEAVVAAYARVDAAAGRLARARTDAAFGSPAERSAGHAALQEASLDLMSGASSLSAALRPVNPSALPAARALAEGGTPLAGRVDRLAGAVRVASLAGPVPERDLTDLSEAVDELRRWARPLFAGEYAAADAADLAEQGPAGLAALRPFAGNPDARAQYLLAWVAASAAGSPAEAEEVLGALLDDGLAQAARAAVLQRLSDPLSATVFGDRPVAAWTAPAPDAPGAGDLAVGTVVDVLGAVPATNAARTGVEWYTRLRVRASGRIVYLRDGPAPSAPLLVRSTEAALVRATGSATPDAVRLYLGGRNRIQFSADAGPLRGDGKSLLLLTGSYDPCGSCHGRWITIWDPERQVAVWEGEGDSTVVALLPGGNGFELTEPVRLDGEPMCCPTRYRTRTLTWDGTTFVPGDVRETTITAGSRR